MTSERGFAMTKKAEIEKKLSYYLADDFVGSEVEFWKLLHKINKLDKEKEIEKLQNYLQISRKEAEKLLKPFF